MSRRSTQCTRYATKFKDESSEIKRKVSGIAKNKHSTDCRVHGFNTFHLVQCKIYDVYCSCACCSSQHHTNAKTKLSNRAGLSSTVLTAHNILLPAGVISRIALQSLCLWYSDRNVSLSALKSPSFRALVLLYCRIDIRTKSNTDECGEFATTHKFVIFSFVMPWSTSCLLYTSPSPRDRG